MILTPLCHSSCTNPFELNNESIKGVELRINMNLIQTQVIYCKDKLSECQIRMN